MLCQVAVKKLHEAQMTLAFESELTIMCALRHPNTVYLSPLLRGTARRRNWDTASDSI
jgi:hypothetical protein